MLAANSVQVHPGVVTAVTYSLCLVFAVVVVPRPVDDSEPGIDTRGGLEDRSSQISIWITFYRARLAL